MPATSAEAAEHRRQLKVPVSGSLESVGMSVWYAPGECVSVELTSEPFAIGEMHGEQSLVGRQQTARCRYAPAIAFKLFNDLALTSDALLCLDDVPFSFDQVFLPNGAVHRASGHLSKTQGRSRPQTGGTPLNPFWGKAIPAGSTVRPIWIPVDLHRGNTSLPGPLQNGPLRMNDPAFVADTSHPTRIGDH